MIATLTNGICFSAITAIFVAWISNRRPQSPFNLAVLMFSLTWAGATAIKYLEAVFAPLLRGDLDFARAAGVAVLLVVVKISMWVERKYYQWLDRRWPMSAPGDSIGAYSTRGNITTVVAFGGGLIFLAIMYTIKFLAG
jgi:hypothetical protein